MLFRSIIGHRIATAIGETCPAIASSVYRWTNGDVIEICHIAESRAVREAERELSDAKAARSRLDLLAD